MSTSKILSSGLVVVAAVLAGCGVETAENAEQAQSASPEAVGETSQALTAVSSCYSTCLKKCPTGKIEVYLRCKEGCVEDCSPNN